MKAPRITLELRDLIARKRTLIDAMRSEIVVASFGRWRGRFLASGKLTRGKFTPGN